MLCALGDTLTAHTHRQIRLALLHWRLFQIQILIQSHFVFSNQWEWHCGTAVQLGTLARSGVGLQMGDMGHRLDMGIYLGPVWVVYSLLLFFSFPLF